MPQYNYICTANSEHGLTKESPLAEGAMPICNCGAVMRKAAPKGVRQNTGGIARSEMSPAVRRHIDNIEQSRASMREKYANHD